MKNTDEYIYAGIPTFMASPYVDIDESSNYDLVVVGVPIDYGSSSRLGSKYGPRAIREYSVIDRIATGTYFDLDSKSWIQGNKLSICDVGDINIWPTNPERNTQELVKVISEIRKKSFPVVLGGDHSITYANFKACSSILKDKKIGLIHFDAHLDTEGEYMESLPELWHGNPFSKLIEEGILAGSRMVTIGPRGRIGKESYEYTEENNITLITSFDVKEKGIKNVINQVFDLFSKDTDFIFLSIDIDCLDMSIAPGTGTPKYGGLEVKDLIQALIAFKKLPIIGVDLVEVNPQFDPTGNTAIIAGELLYNFLSFGINKEIQPKI